MIKDYAHLRQMTNIGTSMKFGEVISVTDPDNKGRIEIKVLEFVDSIWAYIINPASLNAGVGRITYNIPALGSIVLVDMTSPYTPLVSGVLNSTTSATFDSPDKWGWEDGDGTTLVVDRAAHTFTLTHNSGAVVNIDAAGVVTVTTPSDMNLNSGGDVNIDAAGDVNITGTNVGMQATGVAKIEGATQTQVKSAASVSLQSPVIQTSP